MSVIPTTSDYTAQDYQLPDVPSDPYKTSSRLSANPYGAGTAQNQLFARYQDALDRDPEAGIIDWRTSRLGVTSLGQQLNDISGSGESEVMGRARHEVNPQIDAQIKAFQRQAELANQTGQNQLNSLVPEYAGLRGDLSFGLDQNNTALDFQRNQLLDDTNFAGNRLQEQINPAILAARQSAARSGLLNSTVAIDRVNSGLMPIQNRLADLAQSYQTGNQDVERKRQDYIANYQQQLQNLGTKQSAAAKSIQDQIALQLQQYGNQAIDTEAGRNSAIYTRSGALGDAYKQFGLQQGALTEQQRAAQAAEQLARDQFNYNKSKG